MDLFSYYLKFYHILEEIMCKFIPDDLNKDKKYHDFICNFPDRKVNMSINLKMK
jgi:hypothetical protein